MTPIVDPLGLALEAVIVENPADLAAHRALTDWLSEQADPQLQTRGEFARVQLQLEDRSLSKAEAKKLKAREAELIAAHEHCWIDDPLMEQFRSLGTVCKRIYTRGWLKRLRVDEMTEPIARALTTATCLRVVRELDVDAMNGCDLFPLLGACPYWLNVREFDANVYRDFHHPEALIARLPRLEKLNLVGADLDATAAVRLPLPHLQSLRISEARRMPLREIAANPTLTWLVTLTLIPGPVLPGDPATITFDDFQALTGSPLAHGLRYLTLNRSSIGDAGVRRLIDSGMLARLASLDLRLGTITDDGVRLLVNSPAAAKLYELDLTGNRISAVGLVWLQRLDRVQVLQVSHQQESDDGIDFDDRFLYRDLDEFDSEFE